MRTIADVLHAADQWAAEPATVEEVLDAQRWARQRARDTMDAGAGGHFTAMIYSDDPQRDDFQRDDDRLMMFAIGIVLFAFAILVSVAPHECGPTCGWARHRDEGAPLLRRFRPHPCGRPPGPTAGLHRIRRQGDPAGGFCDIAGMTPADELPADEPYAMYRQKTWKRVATLFAGPAMNFIIGLVLIYAIAVVRAAQPASAHLRHGR